MIIEYILLLIINQNVNWLMYMIIEYIFNNQNLNIFVVTNYC